MTQLAGTKTCIACAAEIPISASKCPNCGTAQSWRRHLPTLAVVLSIILGAGSVFSLLTPIYVEYFTKEFDPSVARIGVNAKAYQILVENRGKMPVVMEYAHVFFGEDLAALEVADNDPVIPARSSKVLTLILPTEFDRPFEIDFRRTENGVAFDRCDMQISIIGSGQQQWFELSEPNDECWSIENFVTGLQAVG